MAKINFKCTFCGFSFTPMSKCRKLPWNLYQYKNFVLKSHFSLIIEYGMYLKCLQKPCCLGWFKTSQPSPMLHRCRTRLNSSKDNFIAKSFRLSTKRKLSTLLNFLFPFVSFIGVFSILKCKTLVLKTTTWWTRASHFVDGWHLLRCQIRFFPHPLSGWHDHWTFVGEWGMGDFTDLVWGKNFSQTSLELEMFSPTCNGVRVFSALYVMSDIFFQYRIFISQELFIGMSFSSRNQSAGHFFLKSPITPSKVKWSASKIHQIFGQLTDSDLSTISKGFWTNRGQNSLGERGGIRFYLPLPQRRSEHLPTMHCASN